jgi:hypothetical protein
MESEREKIIYDNRVDRIEVHLKKLKEDSEIMSGNIGKITTAIIGNEFTGGIGVIHTIKDISERVGKSEDKIAMLEENLTFSKNIIKTLVGVITAYIIYLITK